MAKYCRRPTSGFIAAVVRLDGSAAVITKIKIELKMQYIYISIYIYMYIYMYIQLEGLVDLI